MGIAAAEFPAEEIIGIPGRPLRLIGQPVADQEIGLRKLDPGGKVHLLAQIVRGGVVARVQPVLDQGGAVQARIAAFEARHHKDGGNPLPPGSRNWPAQT